MSFIHESGETFHYGFGDMELGVKYRFITEDDKSIRPQVAFSPSVTIPTGNDRLDIGGGHSHLLLPLWVQKSIGDSAESTASRNTIGCYYSVGRGITHVNQTNQFSYYLGYQRDL
jgi:hypothetical protein